MLTRVWWNMKVMLCLLILTGCGGLPRQATSSAALTEIVPTQTREAEMQPTAMLATPVADTPAAGICSEPQGPIAEMTVRPDVPAPRCLIVRADQRLRVVNALDSEVEVSLGRISALLEAGAETTFQASFGELILPGVHILQATQCCSGSIWLQDGE